MAEDLKAIQEAEKEQERKDLALMSFGCIDHIGDVLADLDSYVERMLPLFPKGHPMEPIVFQLSRAQKDTYNQFKHLLVAGDRLNRYAKPTLYSEAGAREDERANKRWPVPTDFKMPE